MLQGSVQDPQLFIEYINDLFKYFSPKQCIWYADYFFHLSFDLRLNLGLRSLRIKMNFFGTPVVSSSSD